jgi:hypothetical protein
MTRVNRRRRSSAWIAALILAWSVLLPSIAITGAVASATHPPQCPIDYYENVTCELEVTAPATATAGTPFEVTVDVVDEGGLVDEGPCSSGSLSVGLLESDGELVDPDPVVSGGTSTFLATIDDAGTFHLVIEFQETPYANCGHVGGVTSDAIEVSNPGVVVTCPANTICTATTESESGNAQAAITASGGATITAAFSTLGQAGYTACAGTTPRDPGGVLTFAGGSNAAADPQGGFTGSLANCLSVNPRLPCIALRAKDRDGDVSLWVLAKPGDPKGYVR